MSCNGSELLRIEFPKTIVAMFISSTEYAGVQTNAHIANTSVGFLAELEALGQSNAAVGTKALVAAPYPTRLRPLTKLSSIYQATEVMLHSLEFFGYDTTLTGAVAQDADTLTAIYATRATNEAYAQSIYKNALINNWQPNFLRPEFFVDSRNCLDFLSDSNFDGQNLGDLSIGIPLGHCFDLDMFLGKVNEINVNAQLAQYISETSKFQRYAVMCIAKFWSK